MLRKAKGGGNIATRRHCAQRSRALASASSAAMRTSQLPLVCALGGIDIAVSSATMRCSTVESCGCQLAGWARRASRPERRSS